MKLIDHRKHLKSILIRILILLKQSPLHYFNKKFNNPQLQLYQSQNIHNLGNIQNKRKTKQYTQ